MGAVALDLVCVQARLYLGLRPFWILICRICRSLDWYIASLAWVSGSER
jgi:hypothetical protein